MKVTVSFDMEIEDDFLSELRSVVDHHADWLLDLESYPEIMSIYNGKLETGQ